MSTVCANNQNCIRLGQERVAHTVIHEKNSPPLLEYPTLTGPATWLLTTSNIYTHITHTHTHTSVATAFCRLMPVGVVLTASPFHSVSVSAVCCGSGTPLAGVIV